ncbi:MAG: hypothetical protein ACODAA_04280 [Gemmatimonadota bacterium]
MSSNFGTALMVYERRLSVPWVRSEIPTASFDSRTLLYMWGAYVTRFVSSASELVGELLVVPLPAVSGRDERTA